MARPTWDEWGLSLAAAVATRADCSRRQVGAVIVNTDRSVVAEGYNGAPSGEPGCLTEGACPRGRSDVPSYTDGPTSYDTGPGACIALHAEQNAIIRASWAEMRGSTLYTTNEPCGGCWRMIHGSPLAHVIWPSGSWVREPETRS